MHFKNNLVLPNEPKNLLKKLHSRCLRKLSENFKYRKEHNGAKRENTDSISKHTYSNSRETTASLAIKLHYKLKKITTNLNIYKCQEKLFLLKYQETQSPFNKVNKNEIWG